MNRLKRVLSIYSVFMAVLVLAMISAVVQIIHGAPLPMFAGFGHATVLTGSMEPNIPVGSLVVIHAQSDYSVGDAVLYRDGVLGNVTHRIIAIENGMVTTKGDANNTADKAFPEERIIGKVILTIPLLGRIMLKLKEPAVIAVLSIVLVLINVLPVMIKRKEAVSV